VSADRDTERIVRSWLEEGTATLPDRILDAVLDDLPTTPQRRPLWSARRFLAMSTPLRWGAAAIAAVALALIGFSYLGGDRGVGVSPETPSASPSSRLSPSSSPFPSATGAPESRQFIVDEPFPLRISAEVTRAWQLWTPTVGADAVAIYEGSPDPPDGRVIVFAIVQNLLADPCDAAAGGIDPPVGPSVADLAAALADQPNTEATDPVGVSIDGYDGVYLDYTNVGGDAPCQTLTRWRSSMGDREALLHERDQVWILDVNGVRLVIDAASFQGTSAEDLANMRAIIESLSIEPILND
jgi:hypothetical protein